MYTGVDWLSLSVSPKVARGQVWQIPPVIRATEAENDLTSSRLSLRTHFAATECCCNCGIVAETASAVTGAEN